MSVLDAVMRKMKPLTIQGTNMVLGRLTVLRHTRENVRTRVVLQQKRRTTISTVGIGHRQSQLCVVTVVAVIIAAHKEETVQPAVTMKPISPRLHIQLTVI